MMNTFLYKNTQISKIIVFTMVFVFVFIQMTYFKQMGEKPLPLIPYILLSILIIFILLLFYKLTVEIDNKYIRAYFGIGLINKSFLIKDIDFESIEKVEIPWWYGIGLRITPKGILYNVKWGDAIYFKSKDKSKSFFVGTDEFEEIKSILKRH